MNINARTSFVGCFLALSALQISGAAVAAHPTDATPDSCQRIEGRLARLTTLLRQRASLLPESAIIPADTLVAGAWLNGGGGGFLNSPWRNGGWLNGGSFLNSRPWMNGGWINGAWRNGGGFYNYW